ncbi:TlpA family protein disulfide reductase [Kitasatospora phosalacinea]|uniref:TlpA family protein disulfide reductase n=1 Tax=Kitasatospora phosalacinea TaxID=2065 RepID=UPI003658A37F
MILAAAVIVVGAVCAVDLLLSLGIVRRLREHTAELEELARIKGVIQPRGLAAGTPVPDFAAVDTDGAPVRRDALPADALVGFFSPTCGPCKDLLPDFTALAARLPGGRTQTLAVVVGDPDAAGELVAALAPVATVVVERPRGAVSAAFEVANYPTLFSLDAAHRVDAVGHGMAALPGRLGAPGPDGSGPDGAGSDGAGQVVGGQRRAESAGVGR